jgi:hypothetical protein
VLILVYQNALVIFILKLIKIFHSKASIEKTKEAFE